MGKFELWVAKEELQISEARPGTAVVMIRDIRVPGVSRKLKSPKMRELELERRTPEVGKV